MRKILVPVDGSEGSDKAVRFAISLATKDNDEIVILNVQHSYNTPHVKKFFSQEEIQAYQEELSKDVFSHTLELTNNAAVQVRTLLRRGDPGKEISAESKEGGFDFIVMGYRGLGAVKRVIMGSVATNVLHETEIPVVIVP